MKYVATESMSATHILRSGGNKISISPPAHNQAPIPVDIKEDDEEMMRQVNVLVAQKFVRKYTTKDEKAIKKAKKDVEAAENIVEEGKKNLKALKKNHEDAIEAVKSANKLMTGAKTPEDKERCGKDVSTANAKSVAATKAYDKGISGLKIANEQLDIKVKALADLPK